MTDPFAEADLDARLRVIGDELATRVEASIPLYLAGRVNALIAAWGRLDDARADALRRAIADRGPEIAADTGARLRSLLARSAAEQHQTPLEVVANIVVIPTQLLEAAGVPAIVRDEIDERLHPNDRYDLAPRALADLGDPELGPLQLAWGLTKHRALREHP